MTDCASRADGVEGCGSEFRGAAETLGCGAQGLGDVGKEFEGNVVLTAFNEADMVAVATRPFGQLLLSQTTGMPAPTDDPAHPATFLRWVTRTHFKERNTSGCKRLHSGPCNRLFLLGVFSTDRAFVSVW